MPMQRRREEGSRGTTTMGTAWPELVDMITSRQVLSSVYVYTGHSGIKENRAKTNRAISNGESESFDASRFSLSWTVAWTVLRPRSGLPPAACSITVPLSTWFFPHVRFVPFVCPAGVPSNCQKNFHSCVIMTFEQKDIGQT
jgi:hypothetical protein